MTQIKCVLLDIEGTICPISFVKDTLFPYALNALPNMLATKWDSADFAPYRKAFPESAQASPEDFRLHVEDLTKRDVKIAYLKNLQGYLWETGYKMGAYSTPLFQDVAPQLKRWRKDGLELVVYSSGSVFAQKLLFGHVASGGQEPTASKRKREDGRDAESTHHSAEPALKKIDIKEDDQNYAKATTVVLPEGNIQTNGANSQDEPGDDLNGEHGALNTATEDLQYLISDWYDTTNAGSKQESQSYSKIANALKLSAADILFLSDNVREVDAAVEAGMSSIVVDRPGNAALAQADKDRLQIVNSLDEVSLGRAVKDENVDSPQSKTTPSRRSQRLRGKEA